MDSRIDQMRAVSTKFYHGDFSRRLPVSVLSSATSTSMNLKDVVLATDAMSSVVCLSLPPIHQIFNPSRVTCMSKSYLVAPFSSYGFSHHCTSDSTTDLFTALHRVHLISQGLVSSSPSFRLHRQHLGAWSVVTLSDVR